ncbi:hypothetical protein B0J18DRAFT_174077 [Chaetomium sp. MPI-SDFR-AT-0129]|nr:hypothetical protein B0J18DRAFT_174077 [Chaetomium sp. MPI-SDFR-AT-0129]
MRIRTRLRHSFWWMIDRWATRSRKHGQRPGGKGQLPGPASNNADSRQDVDVLYIRTSAAAALLPLSSASFAGDYGGAGLPNGPWYIPVSTYNTLLDSPNATTQYSLKAPDITARFPASNRFANWTLTVSVTADIPVSNINTSVREWHGWPLNQSFTGSRVQLTLPTGGDDDDDNDEEEFEPDRSWEVCVINWDVHLKQDQARLRGDDGTCYSVLSEQCISDMEKQAASLVRCTCPNLREIESCQGDQAETWISETFGYSAKSFNNTDIATWRTEGYTIRSLANDPHPYSHGEINQIAYEEIGRLTWPVLVHWGPRPLPPTGSVWSSVNAPGASAKLTCARAKDAVGESRVPWENGAAGRRRGMMGSSGFALGVVVVVGWVVGW